MLVHAWNPSAGEAGRRAPASQSYRTTRDPVSEKVDNVSEDDTKRCLLASKHTCTHVHEPPAPHLSHPTHKIKSCKNKFVENAKINKYLVSQGRAVKA